MNNIDRSILERIDRCLNIPGCNAEGGAKSISTSGAIGYAKDMTYIIPKVRNALYIASTGEEWEGQLEDILTEMETWHGNRDSEGWQ